MNKKSSSSSGLGLLSVLQIIFLVLKLLKLINWSWWLVFIPTFINIGIMIICLAILGICTLLKYKK